MTSVVAAAAPAVTAEVIHAAVATHVAVVTHVEVIHAAVVTHVEAIHVEATNVEVTFVPRPEVANMAVATRVEVTHVEPRLKDLRRSVGKLRVGECAKSPGGVNFTRESRPILGSHRTTPQHHLSQQIAMSMHSDTTRLGCVSFASISNKTSEASDAAVRKLKRHGKLHPLMLSLLR
jgi:uncharacterized protein (DUF2252 family)